MARLTHRLAVPAVLALAAGAAAADRTVNLKYARFDPLAGEPPIAEALRQGAGRLWMVQFGAAPDGPALASLSGSGAVVVRFIPPDAVVVRTAPGAIKRLASLSGVRWAGPYHPAYRLDAAAAADWLTGAGPARYGIEVMERGDQTAVAAAIRAAGGIIDRISSDSRRLEATIDARHLPALAALDQVNYIDLAGPIGHDLLVARTVTGGVYLHDLGISGQGVRGEVFDTTFDPTIPAFQNPPPLLHGPLAGGSATSGNAVYSAVFARTGDPESTGMLPDRQQGIFASFSTITNYRTHLAELVDPSLPYRAVFHSRSIGNAQVRVYSTITAELDDLLFDTDLAVCQSMSNTGNSNARPEAWAKNIIAVAGVDLHDTAQRDDDSWPASSTGPAIDGRVKPDVASPWAYQVVTSSPGGYTTMSGTSISTPLTAGAVGLIAQLWHQGAWPGHGGGASVFDDRPHMTTLKALVISGTYQYNWLAGGPNATLTRFRQGWGMTDLRAVRDSASRTFVIDESDVLEDQQVRSYQFTVAPGEPLLRATMVYADPAGNPAAQLARINDLTLRVIGPDNTVYWGNNGVANGLSTPPGGQANTVDTVENVIIPNPAPGTWSVEVSAAQLLQDARPETPGVIDADFALVVRGVVLPCYSNCDGSTLPPVLNVNDLVCFQSRFAAQDPYADCDRNNTLNVNDFVCFQAAFAAGCP